MLILIVSQLCQKVHRGDLRVRDSEQADCKRHCALNDRLAILVQMVHGAKSHLHANVFTKGNQGDTDYGSNLMVGLFFVLLVLRAEVEHFLNLEDVT